MQAQKKSKVLPTSLVEAYKQAFDEAEQTSNPDEKVMAYAKVIDFCANTKSCRWKPNLTRNTLLYWAHNNIAKAFVEEESYARALHYWQKALLLAADDAQRINIWEQMIEAWGKAKVPVAERCAEIIKLITPLSEAYGHEMQPLEIKRLAKLKERLLGLIKKSAH